MCECVCVCVYEWLSWLCYDCDESIEFSVRYVGIAPDHLSAMDFCTMNEMESTSSLNALQIFVAWLSMHGNAVSTVSSMQRGLH